MLKADYIRPYARKLATRLAETRRFIQVLAGPRQIGKTTLLRQVLTDLGQPYRYVTADEPTLRDRAWLTAQWDEGRRLATDSGKGGATLVIDEAQKISDWPETVKRLWDEDTASGLNLRIVLVGSAPLLMQRGLSESLAGRFEVIRLPHWSYPEMRDAFGFTLDEYIWYGAYPGAAPLIGEPERWRRYILDSLIETTVSRDVLLLARVDKPALLRRAFELACRYSGQILSYSKMLGQLDDAGNTTTIAHYVELLSGAGLVTGLQKFAGQTVRSRGSSPKFQVLNNALMTAQIGLTLDEARDDTALWGRLVESAVGTHLANAAATGLCEVYFWRERNREVDFVVRTGRALIGVEVKSARVRGELPGLGAFSDAYKPTRLLIVGKDGIPIEEFLSNPLEQWLRA